VTAGSVAFILPWLVLGAAATDSVVLALLATLTATVLAAAVVRTRDRFEQRMAIRLAGMGLGVCSLLIVAALRQPAWPFGVAALVAAVASLAARPNKVGQDEPHLLRDLVGADAVGEQHEVHFCVFLPRVIATRAEALVLVSNGCDGDRALDFSLVENPGAVLDPVRGLRVPDLARAELGPLACGVLRIPVGIQRNHSRASSHLGFQLQVTGSDGTRRVRWRANAYQNLGAAERLAGSHRTAVRGYPVTLEAGSDAEMGSGDALQARFELLDRAEFEARAQTAVACSKDEGPTAKRS